MAKLAKLKVEKTMMITNDGARSTAHSARCAIYRDSDTSEVAFESYLLSETLAERTSLGAVIICNGDTLARSIEGAHWSLTPAGQRRLGWEASLLKER